MFRVVAAVVVGGQDQNGQYFFTTSRIILTLALQWILHVA